MVEKRKLPARAAARVEQIAKKRNITPPSAKRSESSAPPPEPTPDPKTTPVEEAPTLPKSISAGNPLPTVETPQPDDLSNKDYQSVAESGVLAESITRSRQRWISEGIFEKYWSKPIKKKGVIQEEPNNPPKDSMVKLGQVTITVEPHVFEATMFAVKDPKPAPPPPQTSFRPVLQYGPPNGVMPPPPTPKATPSAKLALLVPTPSQPQTPAQVKAEISPSTAQTPTHTPTQASARVSTQPQATQPAYGQTPTLPPTPTFTSTAPRPPVASPRGMESVLEPNSVVPQPQRPSVTAQNNNTLQTRPSPSIGAPSTGNGNGGGLSAPSLAPMRPAVPAGPKPSTPGAPAAVPGADPIILTLAEKAGEDPQLRDLMKKVAQGNAAKHELERFQAIIDAITAESKRGPSADKLVVDGRTVRYFAEEVRAILDIVLRSNPKETSAHLLPPAGTDPLVVMLVKTALDDAKTKEMIQRIANKTPRFSDATDLKATLDRLCDTLAKDKERKQAQSAPPSPATATATATPKSNGVPSGQASSASVPQPAQQALRSKGPPPPPKPDISAIVFEFVGGTGDRYMFPKFSVLETLPVPAPQQQVVASFLIVRRGSKAEYPMADPDMDYYQPVTIRLFTSTGRHLENLARVVAPQEEVRRYMDDIMEKMTRAEYVLLAMRLPRGDKDGESSPEEREKSLAVTNGGPTAKQAAEAEQAAQAQAQAPVLQAPQPPPPTVMWATRPPKPEIREVTRSKIYKPMDVDDQYQSFISTVKKKEPKDV